MDKMQSPLKGLTDIQQPPVDPTQTDPYTPEDTGLRKLTSHLSDRKLTSKLTIDKLDTHLGDEEVTENKVDDKLTIPKLKDRIEPKEDSILDGLRIFVPPKIRDYNTLMKFLQTHIVEFRFTRRHEKAGYSNIRRMVCTANWKYLSSMFTRKVFNWNTPKTRRGVSWYKRRGLIIVWDLMVQNFRIVPVSTIQFVSAFKCTNLMEKGKFIMFYRKFVGTLTPVQERKYFNS